MSKKKKSRNKVFGAALIAFRPNENLVFDIRLGVAQLVANSPVNAHKAGLRHLIEECPQSEGWMQHGVDTELLVPPSEGCDLYLACLYAVKGCMHQGITTYLQCRQVSATSEKGAMRGANILLDKDCSPAAGWRDHKVKILRCD